MPTVVHVCSDVYSSEVPVGTNQTHTPPLIRISPLYTELPPIFSQTFLWVVYRAQLPPFFLLARLQGGATANFLAGVSVGRSQGAANAFR